VSGGITAAIAWTRRRSTAAAALVLALSSAALWHEGRTYVEEVSSTLPGILELVKGDSEHYLAIAASIREGDYSMSHVEPTGSTDRAHRQPGYPGVIAVAEKLGFRGAPRLALVNVAIVVAALWIAFAGARIATGSALAGLIAAAVVYDAGFLFEIATGRLLTEPTYVAVTLGACSACLAYLRKPGAVSLLLAAGLSGFAYLVRVNGLMLAASLATALLVSDLHRARRRHPEEHGADLVLHLPLAAYALAAALFVVVTLPSWLPRVIYTGNPVYHGYLPNYLWVDEYERAHVPGPPQFSFSTYAAEHSVADAAKRMKWGLERVFWDTPRDKLGIVASLGFVAAIVVLLITRSAPGIVLACAGILQALPLAWTALANPARRLPAAALLPFVALVIAAAVAILIERGLTPLSPEKRQPSDDA
jgi:hypothetical protein